MAKIKSLVLDRVGEVPVPEEILVLSDLDQWPTSTYPGQGVVSPGWLKRDLERLHHLGDVVDRIQRLRPGGS